MTLSVHVVVDHCPPEMLNRVVLYCQRVKQLRYINVAAGAQIDLGMQYVERLRRDAPHVNVIWRNLDPEDTGILATMTAEKLYNDKVKKHLAWFQKTKAIFMPDNETTGDDQRIKTYVDQLVNILRWLHADGLNGAVLRFPTGNPNDGSDPRYPSQYPLLKPVFDVMLPGDVISPNEYSNKPGDSSGGNIARYKLMWNVAGRELPTVIGEAGITINYNPGMGYLLLNISDEAYANYLLGQEPWYKNGAIDRCVFKVGGTSHDSFNLRPGFFDYLEGYYNRDQPPIVIPPPEPVLPAFPSDFETRAKAGVTITTSGVHVRKQPSVSAESLMIVPAFDATTGRYIPLDQLRIAEKVESLIDGKNAYWQPVQFGNVQGWVWSGIIQFKDPPPPIQLQALKTLREHVNTVANRTRQMSLELAGMSDDLLMDVALLDALIAALETP